MILLSVGMFMETFLFVSTPLSVTDAGTLFSSSDCSLVAIQGGVSIPLCPGVETAEAPSVRQLVRAPACLNKAKSLFDSISSRWIQINSQAGPRQRPGQD